MDRPLADRIRPQTIDEVVGQKHLLGPNALLRRFIEKGTDANMVFYGPSGTGKTTIANIIAKRTHRTLYKLNATTASLQDIKDIIGDVGTMMAPGGVLLYLDEIQYFNKKQQQSLLEFMENGSITLIASTTENPPSTSTPPSSAGARSLSSSPSPPMRSAPPWSGPCVWWGRRARSPCGGRRECPTTLPTPAAGTCGRP